MSSLRRSLAVVAIMALFGAGALTGCGSDDDDEATAEPPQVNTEESAESVSLVADDRDGYTFELSATPSEETTSVTFDNQGKEPHALVLARINDGFTVDEAVELEGKQGSAETYIEDGAGPGQTRTFEITKPLEPGNYAFLCPIPAKQGPHYKLGQLEEFAIG